MGILAIWGSILILISLALAALSLIATTLGIGGAAILILLDHI